MKKEFVRATIEKGQLAKVKADFKDYRPPSDYAGLCELLADVIDTAASGTECYCTFGLARDGSAILLTVHYNHSKLYASGATLKELAIAAGELV